MLGFIVRSRKDAAAVEAMAERFYSGWDTRVYTMKGVRRADEMAEAIKRIIDERPGFYIVLLGREDAGKAPLLEEQLPPTAVVHVVPRARVRNARLEMLYMETLRARAALRLRSSWEPGSQVYLAGPGGEPLEGLEPEPSHEAFIGVGVFNRLVSRLAGARIGSNPLVVRASGGLHLVYNGPRVRARLWVGDEGLRPRAEAVGDAKPVDVELGAMVEANRGLVEWLVRASGEWLRRIGEGYDTIVVPWSGGKDSTAALLLALEVFGRKRVRVVYGDTGTEFPASQRYVEETARKLGIDYEVAYAGIDRALAEGAPMPSHDNRWCTGLKIEAIERKILELAEGRTLVVVGDRDAESVRRSERPPIRPGYREGITVASPLKPWGGHHVQLYILSRGVELNPMYGYGFYRIGCYMCPALRNWELYAITSNPRLYAQLVGKKPFRMFMKLRVFSKARGLGGGDGDCTCSL